MRRTQARTTVYFLLAIVASVVLINLSHTAGVQRAKGIAQAIILPAVVAIDTASNGVSHVLGTLQEIGQVRQENQELRNQVDRLETELARLQADKNENVALKEALKFQQERPGKIVTANVVAREPEGLARTVLLDVGDRNGVKPNMVVVTGRGLVGRVAEVGPLTAKVVLALDTNSKVNAQLPVSRAAGTVEGTGVGMQIKITTPPAGLSVGPGEEILTSGLGGNYPAKLRIGRIANFQRRDYAIEQLADVQPAVDFARLQLVLVLLDFLPLR